MSKTTCSSLTGKERMELGDEIAKYWEPVAMLLEMDDKVIASLAPPFTPHAAAYKLVDLLVFHAVPRSAVRQALLKKLRAALENPILEAAFSENWVASPASAAAATAAPAAAASAASAAAAAAAASPA